ncbi:MAG: hypothetical protein GY822_02205 [Deltaproteobacteria bacterium]|nr:hypothetical protein [Deltaproteobacteria bacterium]
MWFSENRSKFTFVAATMATLMMLFTSTASAQAPDESASDDANAAPKNEEPEKKPTRQATPPKTRAPPALPSNADLKALTEAPRFAKNVFRRVARTSPDAGQRAYALRVLAVRSPRTATSHICARSLLLDDSNRVRRSAAECLGRLPSRYGEPRTPALLSALSDDDIDVVTMAAWALANVGGPEALAPLVEGTRHKDPKVAKLFYTYAERLRVRQGMDYSMGPNKKIKRGNRLRLVPAPSEMFGQLNAIERTVSTGWLALYGGMSGWAHGGLLTAAHGPKSKELSLLSAVGGVIVGGGLAGAYGFFMAPTLQEAHTVVQLGTMGAITGFGAGLLSDRNPTAGVNAASLSALGTLVGAGTGVLLNMGGPPSRGALASGFAVSLGTSAAALGISLGLGLRDTESYGLILAAAGISGTMTTILVGKKEVGLRAPVFGTVGGVVAASAVAGLFFTGEGGQVNGEFPLQTGSGIAVAGAYVLGAATGAVLALLYIPADLDPFLSTSVKVNPPSFAVIQDAADPKKQTPMAMLSGRF